MEMFYCLLHKKEMTLDCCIIHRCSAAEGHFCSVLVSNIID